MPVFRWPGRLLGRLLKLICVLNQANGCICKCALLLRMHKQLLAKLSLTADAENAELVAALLR